MTLAVSRTAPAELVSIDAGRSISPERASSAEVGTIGSGRGARAAGVGAIATVCPAGVTTAGAGVVATVCSAGGTPVSAVEVVVAVCSARVATVSEAKAVAVEQTATGIGLVAGGDCDDIGSLNERQ